MNSYIFPLVLLLALIFGFSQKLLAQEGLKKFSLRPTISMHHNFFYEDKNLSQSHELFNKEVQDLTLDPRFGILLDYQFSPKWTISAGVVGAGVGYGSSMQTENLYYYKSSHYVAGYTQFPLIITYNGKPFEALSLGKSNTKILKGRPIYGFGVNFNRSNGNRINENLNYTSTSFLLFHETGNSYYRNHNFGLQASLGIQFQRADGKDNVRLELIYHKGLLKQIQYNLTYWETSMPNSNHGVISSRGSWLGLRLSYPIQLKSW